MSSTGPVPSAEPMKMLKGKYGLDAPIMLVIGLLIAMANVAAAGMAGNPRVLVAWLFPLACIVCGLHTSLRGKFLVWAEVLDGLGLNGDERILDLGCGRGAVLLSAAKRLKGGRAFGVDIWSVRDQSGNAAAATRRNAVVEGVAAKVSLATGDATALPFRPEAFDVITSNVVIHNIKSRPARLKAVEEAVRVLRPGGRIVLADLSGTRDYAACLAALGMVRVESRSLGWRMWWGGPWVPTRLVTAKKRAD